MITLTIRYGGQATAKQFAPGSTVSTLINDRDLKAELGYSDNVRVLVGGVEQPNNALLVDGGNVFIETRANSKAN